MIAVDDAATKALKDNMRTFFRRLVSGASRYLPQAGPRKPTAAEVDEAQRQARQAKAKELSDKAEALFNSTIEKETDRLADGDITPRVFRAHFLRELRFAAYTVAAAGAGGIGNLRPEDLTLIDNKMREQAQFLDNWISQLERGSTRNPDYLRFRAQLYSGAAGSLRQALEDRNQFRDLPDLPFIPKDGTTLCLTRCKCHWEWKNVDANKGDADVYWTLGIAEHCQTCIDRAEAFNPLKIRNFEFINMPDLRELRAR